MNRTLYFVIGGFCLTLTLMVAAEFDWSVTEVAASPSNSGHGDASSAAVPAPLPDLDRLTDEVLARPLFSPGRQPPPPPMAEAKDEDAEPVKTPPVLTGRLTGMLIGPDQLKVAFFTRESEPSLSVKEGESIEGWTVTSIEPDRVVLTSEFGERIVEPTFGQSGRAPIKPPKPVKKTGPNPVRSPQAIAVGPGQVMRPGGQVFGRPNPAAANRPQVPTAARQSPRQ